MLRTFALLILVAACGKAHAAGSPGSAPVEAAAGPGASGSAGAWSYHPLVAAEAVSLPDGAGATAQVWDVRLVESADGSALVTVSGAWESAAGAAAVPFTHTWPVPAGPALDGNWSTFTVGFGTGIESAYVRYSLTLGPTPDLKARLGQGGPIDVPLTKVTGT